MTTNLLRQYAEYPIFSYNRKKRNQIKIHGIDLNVPANFSQKNIFYRDSWQNISKQIL